MAVIPFSRHLRHPLHGLLHCHRSLLVHVRCSLTLASTIARQMLARIVHIAYAVKSRVANQRSVMHLFAGGIMVTSPARRQCKPAIERARVERGARDAYLLSLPCLLASANPVGTQFPHAQLIILRLLSLLLGVNHAILLDPHAVLRRLALHRLQRFLGCDNSEAPIQRLATVGVCPT